MKHVFTLLVFLACMPFAGRTQTILEGAAAQKAVAGAEIVRYVDRTTAPAYIRLQSDRTIPVAHADRWLRDVLGMRPSEAWVPANASHDHLGYTHQRYHLEVDGRLVESSTYILHIKNGHVESANGDYYPNLQPSMGGILSEPAALQAALGHVGAQHYRWEDPAEEHALRMETGNLQASYFPLAKLVMVPRGGNLENPEFVFAYRFDVYALEPLSRAYIYVDAHTGEIVWEHNRIHTADVVGTAMTRYSGSQSMTADQTAANSYRLRETGRGNGIQTYDLNNGSSYGAAVDFTDTDNIWNNINAQQDEVATDAHWGAEKTYDFFWTSFGRNSIDGNGFLLRSYVHYGNNYNNAFWDGQRMTYGDGDGSTFDPLTALDVAGHEITHGLTTFSANLVYQNQSGALNESFSDIFGNAIEFYGRPSQWSWRIGEDMTPNGAGIRNMQNPGTFGDPDTYLGNNWYTGTGDNGGVHINSGVQNKWYYILTMGESGTNDIGSVYNVTGQGRVKSTAIAFRNLTVYLTQGSNYADARFYGIQSAIDLYGACTPEVIATTNAWYAVGVGAAFNATVSANFTATPLSSCSAPATVNFTNSSVNGGTFLWNFGDGNTSTATNPTHTYTNLGTYTVTLTANGGTCGNNTLTRTNYISVDTNNSCTVTMNPTGPNTTQTSCSGSIYDTGGPSSNYGPNTNSVITIAPTGAASVTLNFSSFSFETNYDYLYIYNGPSTSSPLIGAYTGTTLPNGGSVTAASGVMTLRQYTDPAVEQSGFSAAWTCLLPSTPPNVNFVANNLTSCNGIVQFTDLTTNGATTWNWNFGDGFTSTQQHPLHTYQSNGIYTVTLTATNLIGSDTLVRTAYITVNKPAGPSALGASRCGPGSVTLTSTGANPKSWYDASLGGNLVGTGNSFVTPVHSSSVVYYLEETVPAASQYVGPANPAVIGGGGQHNNTSVQYLTFTVTAPVTLRSFYVDPGAAGNRTITLWDNAGNYLRDTTINIGSAPGRVVINWTIQPGSYRIGGTQMDLYRNNAGTPAFPYSIAGLVSITGTSAGAAFYYYFYDWEVKPQACVSQRTPVPVTIQPLPTPSITPGPTANYCPGGSVTLTASGGNTYVWSTGATASTLNVSTSGNYYVIATNGAGCSDTSGVVNVSPFVPQATITPNGPTTLCPGGSVTLAASAGTNYQWSTGATSAAITVSTSGTYSVTLTDPNGCTATASQVVSVTTTPTVSITPSGSTSLCQGDQVTLTATSGATYAWSNGATTQSITVSQAGTFSVSVSFAGGCSGNSPTTTVTVNPLPTASINSSSGLSFCAGGSTQLTASGASNFAWSTGASSAAIPVTQTGSYTVTVTDGNGCEDTETISINVLPLPNASVSGDTAVCENEQATITATGGVTYDWSNGAGGSTIIVTSGGVYTVTVTGANGCTATANFNLTVHPNPAANFSFTQNQLDVSFNDLSNGASTWHWDFGDGNSSTQQSPIYTYGASGTYSVMLIVTNAFGCVDTTVQSVTVTVVGIEDALSGGLLNVNGIYPNPFHAALTFDLNLGTSGTLRISAHDMLGRELGLIYAGEVPAGVFKHQWGTPSLARGTYMMVIEFEGERVMKKVVRME